MNTCEVIRKSMAARMRRLPGMGIVHEYERFSKQESAFRELYIRDGALLGWHIRRVSLRETEFSSQFNRVRVKWQIRGLAALVDSAASELVLDNLVDALRDDFRRFPVLPLTCAALEALAPETDPEDMYSQIMAFGAESGFCRLTTDEGAGLQIDDSGPVMFAGVLCHSVRLGLTTEHLEEIEPHLSEGHDVGGYDADGCPLTDEDGNELPYPCGEAFSVSLAIVPGDPEFKTKGETHE